MLVNDIITIYAWLKNTGAIEPPKLDSINFSTTDFRTNSFDGAAELSPEIKQWLEDIRAQEQDVLPAVILWLAIQITHATDKRFIFRQTDKLRMLLVHYYQLDPNHASAFYNAHQELIAAYPAGKFTFQKTTQNTLSSMKLLTDQFLAVLKDKLEPVKAPLSLAILFKQWFSDLPRFSAALLWLIHKEVSIQNIIRSPLLGDFLMFHYHSQDDDEPPVQQLYTLLKDYPEARPLIETAQNTGLNKANASLCPNANLTGDLLKVAPTIRQNDEYDKVAFFIDEYLVAEFNISYLYQLILLYHPANDALRKLFSQHSMAWRWVAQLIEHIVKQGPSTLLLYLAELISTESLTTLLEEKNGYALFLLIEQPGFIGQMTESLLESWLNERDIYLPDKLDQIVFLSNLHNKLHRRLHPSTPLILNYILQLILNHLNVFAADYSLSRYLIRHCNRSMLQNEIDELDRQWLERIDNMDWAQCNKESWGDLHQFWSGLHGKLSYLLELSPDNLVFNYLPENTIDLFLIVFSKWAQVRDQLSVDEIDQALDWCSSESSLALTPELRTSLLIYLLVQYSEKPFKNSIIELLAREGHEQWSLISLDNGLSVLKHATHHKNLALIQCMANLPTTQDIFTKAFVNAATHNDCDVMNVLVQFHPQINLNQAASDLLASRPRKLLIPIIELFLSWDDQKLLQLTTEEWILLLSSAAQRGSKETVDRIFVKIPNVVLSNDAYAHLLRFSSNDDIYLQIKRFFNKNVISEDILSDWIIVSSAELLSRILDFESDKITLAMQELIERKLFTKSINSHQKLQTDLINLYLTWCKDHLDWDVFQSKLRIVLTHGCYLWNHDLVENLLNDTGDMEVAQTVVNDVYIATAINLRNQSILELFHQLAEHRRLPPDVLVEAQLSLTQLKSYPNSIMLHSLFPQTDFQLTWDYYLESIKQDAPVRAIILCMHLWHFFPKEYPIQRNTVEGSYYELACRAVEANSFKIVDAMILNELFDLAELPVQSALIKALIDQRLDMIQLVFSRIKNSSETQEVLKTLFNCAVEHNNIEAIKHLSRLQHFQRGLLFKSDEWYGFINRAIQNKDHDVTKVLIDVSTVVFNEQLSSMIMLSEDNELINYLRNKQYPMSYRSLLNPMHSTLKNCTAILLDYTRNNSIIQRFFSGHWNRNHIEEITDILDKVDNNTIMDEQTLLEHLERIVLKNPCGSLAKRISFIREQVRTMVFEPHASDRFSTVYKEDGYCLSDFAPLVGDEDSNSESESDTDYDLAESDSELSYSSP